MKMSNQLVTNADFVTAAKYLRILFHALDIVELAAFYMPPQCLIVLLVSSVARDFATVLRISEVCLTVETWHFLC